MTGRDVDIEQFIHEQREAVEENHAKERDRDRDRRADRDRSRERRDRRDRSDRYDRRDDSRRSDSRHRDRDYRDRDGRDRDYRDNEYGDSDYRDNDRRDSERDRDYRDRMFEDGYPEDYHSYHSFARRNEYDDYDSRSYDRRGYGGESRYRSEKAADKWMSDLPTHTILIKGLPPHVEEKDIRAELMAANVPLKEIRVVKDKLTGASRGFAFVEFQTVNAAQQWMEHNQGELRLLNQYTVRLFFSTPKLNNDRGGGALGSGQHSQPGGAPGGVIGDWICSKCGVHNFKRREHCFKCNVSREESDRDKDSDGYDQVGLNPCNTLILRGLDALTSEISLRAALSRVTMLPLKNIHVIRDENGVSRSFAFLEMESMAHSTQLLDTMARLRFPLDVDGKGVMISFAKNTFTTVMATLKQLQPPALSAADYATYQKCYGQQALQQYYKDYYRQQAAAAGQQQPTTAAVLAQAVVQQANAARGMSQASSQVQEQAAIAEPVTSPPSGQPDASGNYPTFPTPDVSTYQYEETSGYYYDASTGLYYDANSQYYYNASTSEFMYWDASKNTYLPAPSAQQQNAEKTNGEKKEKKDKVKVAKKIAKDMEKWAKSMNAQKESQSVKLRQAASSAAQARRESAAADAGFAMLEKVAQKSDFILPGDSSEPVLPESSGSQSGSNTALVASYGDDSDGDDDDTLDEGKLIDYSKLTCLLCKRQFGSKDILQKHQQMSDLHKKNLEELRKSKASAGGGGGGLSDMTSQIQYRDRAKERREKYGAPAPPEPRFSKSAAKPAPEPYEQPTKQGLGADNVGNKLLQKMGWSAGEGLGKNQQGIVDPLSAARRQQGAGLGAAGSTSAVDPEVAWDYRQAAKQQLFARYRELN